MHADHITGTGYLKQLLPSVQSVISGKSGAQADKYLEDGDVVQFGRHEIKAVTTPGHTNGCMTYINYEQVKCLTFGLIWEYFGVGGEVVGAGRGWDECSAYG